MAVGASTFNFAGGAVDDLFSVGAFKTKAKGFDLEAANYDAAAGMADQNADFTRISTGLKLMQIERQKFNVLGGQLTHPAVAEALGKPFVDPYGAWA